MKIKSLLLVTSTLALLTLSGCSKDHSNGHYDLKTRCLDGVLYYSQGHLLAPAYNVDGSVKLCEENK